MLGNELVWVRGAGELGSGVAHLLHRVGLPVFMSDISPPLAIRRPVTFSDALSKGQTEVEGVTAFRPDNDELSPNTLWDHIPIFEDDPDKQFSFNPTIVVDARMLKKDVQDFRSRTNLFIGLGPGFKVDRNCHFAIETMRGHDLGRIISKGTPQANTGVPGNLGGETIQRLVRATRSGKINWFYKFGDIVNKGQRLGLINHDKPIFAPLSGLIRGMISEDTPVERGMKIGDIDPRGEEVAYQRISEKTRIIASGVFEAIVLHNNEQSA